jgi:hypothetical protein
LTIVEETDVVNGVDKRISVIPAIYNPNSSTSTTSNSLNSSNSFTHSIRVMDETIVAAEESFSSPLEEPEDLAANNYILPVQFSDNPEEIRHDQYSDTLVEKDFRQIGKLDLLLPIPEVKLEKTKEKKTFPVAMDSDQEPKKQPTWMWKSQFVNPTGTESTFKPVSPVDEEDEEDIDLYAPPAPTSHVAIESYNPRQIDEMYIQKGDLIGIEKEYGDGW